MGIDNYERNVDNIKLFKKIEIDLSTCISVNDAEAVVKLIKEINSLYSDSISNCNEKTYFQFKNKYDSLTQTYKRLEGVASAYIRSYSEKLDSVRQIISKMSSRVKDREDKLNNLISNINEFNIKINNYRREGSILVQSLLKKLLNELEEYYSSYQSLATSNKEEQAIKTLFENKYYLNKELEKYSTSFKGTGKIAIVCAGYQGYTVYNGMLSNGKPNGNGTAKYPDGSSYEGEWKDGLRHGEGKLKDKSGKVIDYCSWNNDNKDPNGDLSKYLKAKKLFDNEDYYESSTIFGEISFYKDSKEYIQKIRDILETERIRRKRELEIYKSEERKYFIIKIIVSILAIAISIPLLIYNKWLFLFAVPAVSAIKGIHDSDDNHCVDDWTVKIFKIVTDSIIAISFIVIFFTTETNTNNFPIFYFLFLIADLVIFDIPNIKFQIFNDAIDDEPLLLEDIFYTINACCISFSAYLIYILNEEYLYDSIWHMLWIPIVITIGTSIVTGLLKRVYNPDGSCGADMAYRMLAAIVLFIYSTVQLFSYKFSFWIFIYMFVLLAFHAASWFISAMIVPAISGCELE